MDELKPCPFCGALPDWTAGMGWFAVECTGCHVETDAYTEAETAAEVWNRRAHSGVPKAPAPSTMGADQVWSARRLSDPKPAAGVATGQPAHSKSEYKRRVAQGDPNILPPAQQWLEAAKEAQAGFADALTSGVQGRAPEGSNDGR